MTFLTHRPLVSLVALAVLMVFSPALSAQETARLTLPTLPDAPRPQIDLTSSSDTEPQTSSSSQQATPQTTTPTTDTSQKPSPDSEKKETSEDQLRKELHQRMAGVVPNFNAVLGGDALPLSPGQKMRAAFRSAIDPYQFGLALVTSGYGQATDSHSSIDSTGFRHGYEQGAVGYGKRFGANFADQFDGTIIGNGLLPILLHQDARYYRMGTGSFKKRFIYSLSTTVRCKGDNGKWQPNYSNVLGNIAAGGISNLYYPQADRGFGLTIEQGMTVTAEGAFGALLIEFYPDIRRHIHGKRPPADIAPPSAAVSPYGAGH